MKSSSVTLFKVYVVRADEYIYGVFSALEKAKEFCEQLPSIHCYRILSFKLDNQEDLYGKTEWVNA